MEEKRKYFRKTFKQNENRDISIDLDTVVFEDCDTLLDKAIKTTHLFAGSSELVKELAKIGVNCTKVQRGAGVFYILRGKGIERTEVKL